MQTALDPLAYRRVVGRFATGVTVVTTTLQTGEQHAMTCSSFTSVSLDPVMVLFCPEKIARFHDAVLESGTWAVSVLSRTQQPLSRHFAHRGRDLSQQFADVPWTRGALSGAPLLTGSLAVLECRTVSLLDAGDHTVVLGEVLGMDVPDPEAEPLLYVEGAYRAVAPD